MATKQLAPKSDQWTQSQLTRLKRDELEKVAKELGVEKPHLAKNKETLVFLALEIQGEVVDDPESLNQRQRRFCELYITDIEFAGDGVYSYAEAYDINLSKPGAYEAAKSHASRLLKHPAIVAYCTQLLEQQSLNDVNVDKQLGFLVNQFADLKTKLGAIKEYNTMKERVQRNAPGTLNMNFFSFSDKRAKELIDKHEAWMLENTKAIIDASPTDQENS